MNEKWFAMSVEEIEKKLKTNAALGLSQKAASARCDNERAPFFTVKKRPWSKLLVDIVADFFLVMLLLVAFFSLFFEGDYIIGSAALVLVLVNLGVTYFLYYRDTKAIESMSDFFSPTARVIRGGKLYICDYKDVVEGDVILIEKGDMLGCDARLVYSDGLCVRMRLDKKREKLLQKFAGGAIDPTELHAENMANMIHAGSVVKKGSGRAIVVATGEYTYLGAVTGGIAEIPSRELPEGLRSLKKSFSKIGTAILILMLPFCIFSLMFGHFTGGTVLLSETLMVALAIGATAMLGRAQNLFLGFFARFSRRAALSENPCIIRSLKAFDDMANADYLFMLDGSIATDGILHFDSLITMDGEIERIDTLTQSATYLRDMIGLYKIARSGALSVAGVGSVNALESGMDEFLRRSRVDLEALKIRCKIHSFLPGVERDGSDVIDFSDIDERRSLYVSLGSAVLDECDCAMFGGIKKSLTDEGRAAIKRSYASCVARGKSPVVFALKDAGQLCFVGMLVLCEGVDPNLSRALSNLRRSGVNVISFSCCVGRQRVPEIPAALRNGGRAYAGEFLKRGLSISYSFGAYDEYCGFDEVRIAELARYVKSQNKTLAIMGFSDYAKEAIECADVFISCAPIRTESGGRMSEEIRSLEIPGEMSSAACTQEVKSMADILLMRPADRKGGLEPLARVIEYGRIAYRNLRNYTYYLVIAQMMRIISVALPMLFGYSTADVRQMLYLGFVFDLFVLLIFMSDSRRSSEDRRRIRKDVGAFDILAVLKANSKLTVCAAVGAGATVILPRIAALLEIFGKYFYRAEFTYISLVLLQALVFICIYAKDLQNRPALLKLINNRLAQICAGVTVLFTALCFLTPIGRFFGIIESQLFYFFLAFLPAVAFFVCYLVLGSREKTKKGVKRAGKL